MFKAIMTENFLKIISGTKLKKYKKQSCTNYSKSKIKKKKILKKSEGKSYITYKGAKIKIISDFSETMKTIREWSKILKC